MYNIRNETMDKTENEQLRNRWINRKECSNNIILPQLSPAIKRKGKGMIKRKSMIVWLGYISDRQFENEEQEYEAIGKFGIGYWSEEFIEAFNKEEQELIINIIAKVYGAFDY